MKRFLEKRYLIIAAVLLLISLSVAAYLMLRPSSRRRTQPAPITSKSEYKPGPIALEGQLICLPKTSQPTRDDPECVFGIKDNQGRSFILEDPSPGQRKLRTFPLNSTIQVRGAFLRKTLESYDTLGTIRALLINKK